jgi:polyisoprenoid-binding protein YceI
MSTTIQQPQAAVPTGTWQADPVHSSVGFAVKYLGVATFTGELTNFEATLKDGELAGKARVESVEVKDENLKAHLGSPEFFDAERYPEIRFEASQVDVAHDGSLTVAGDLTIKDQAHPLQATGTVTGPAVTFGDVVKLGVTLETVIDRTKYGLNWNAPLPKGGVALADDVKLTVELELAREEA